MSKKKENDIALSRDEWEKIQEKIDALETDETSVEEIYILSRKTGKTVSLTYVAEHHDVEEFDL